MAARNLPPLRAVRAFEAAARSLSMTKAARELGVSPGAISHQIRLLEEFLGARLFLRETRKVSLTPAGRSFLPAITRGLDNIEEAAKRLTAVPLHTRVRVSVETTFAERWLVPRLAEFNAAYPEVEVELHGRPLDPETAAFRTNFAVAYGPRQYHGLAVERMMSEAIFPVCSPEVLETYALKELRDLGNGVRFIHDQTFRRYDWFPTWQVWLARHNLNDVDATQGLGLGTSHMTIVAARDGLGVALARGALVERDLADGTLVAPFGSDATFVFDYQTVGLQAVIEEPDVAIFREWLIEEGRQSPANEQAATGTSPVSAGARRGRS